MIRHTQTALALAFAIASIACGSENVIGPRSQPEPEKPNPRVASINSVRVLPPAELAFVGSTMTMSAVIVADSGARYTVNWSLAAGTTTATIDAATGVLTALAPGNASPIACAVAAPSNGQTQTLCGEATIRVEPDYMVVADHELAFVRNGTVFVARLDGSEPVALVTGGTRPAWSPDRSRIAFTRPADNQLTKWQVCIARSDGSGIRCSTGAGNGRVIGTPSWSPDGKTVAFSVFGYDCSLVKCDQNGHGFSSLLLLNTLTMQVEEAKTKTPPVTSASWSPDGRKIAVTLSGVGSFGRGALGTVNPDGSGLEIMAMSLGSYSVQEATWSPDSRRLALLLTDENACPWYCDTAIGVVSADGTALKILDRAKTAEDAYLWGAPAWSPDGASVAYTAVKGEQCWDERIPCGTDITVVRVADGRKQRLLAGGGLPSWQR